MMSDLFQKKFLIDWLKEHGIFDLIWNPLQTNIQLLIHSSFIFELLLTENAFDSD